MTKAQINDLETKVAVIQNDVNTLKEDTKSVKGLLKWFIVLSVTIIGLVVANLITGYGDKKTMQVILNHNSLIIEDMAVQGIQNGWYKPKTIIYRGNEETKSSN
jgi:hypothetical protein